MSKAYYSTENIGHYGLAFDYYSHFTSPIRRYPDVMAHRLLQHYLDKGKSADAETYEDQCSHSSEMEYLATKAERDSIKFMQIKFMQDHKDENFLGVISGVTEWGIYVEIIDNKCEGMVRLRDISDDHYDFDEENYVTFNARFTGDGSVTVAPELNSSLSTSKFTTSGLTIYPNPVKDIMVLKHASETIESIKVVNMLGAVVLEQDMRSQNLNSVEIDTAPLSQGLYILKTSTSTGKTSNLKFLKR